MDNDEKQQAVSLLSQIIRAVLETVRDVEPQGAPSGVIYAVLMGFGMSHHNYAELVALLQRTGLLRQSNHLLHITPKGVEYIAQAA